MISPLIHCQFCPGLVRCTPWPGRHTWTRIGSLRIVVRIAAMATCAAFGGQDSGYPDALGCCGICSSRIRWLYHTLPVCLRVEFARVPGDRAGIRGAHCLPGLQPDRRLSRCGPFGLLGQRCVSPRELSGGGIRREVQRIPQALQFPIVVECAGPHPGEFQSL